MDIGTIRSIWQARRSANPCKFFLKNYFFLLDIYPIWSYIESVDYIQGVTQNKQVAVVVHKVKVSQTLYTGKNERIDMDRERYLTIGVTVTTKCV